MSQPISVQDIMSFLSALDLFVVLNGEAVCNKVTKFNIKYLGTL